MKKSCRFVLAVLLCPSISMYNQELTGGDRGRKGDRRRKGRREEEREKNAQIFKI